MLPASVTTKAGIPSQAIHHPWKDPNSAPKASMMKMASNQGMCPFVIMTPSSAALAPAIEPRDRSMSPRRSTKISPSAMMATNVACTARLLRLPGERKYCDCDWKKTAMITRLAIAGMAVPCDKAADSHRLAKDTSRSVGRAWSRGGISSNGCAAGETGSLMVSLRVPGCRL